ncbi:hypothetical protein APHAL10511_007997 [Amanita phalloides]|nr:hypothetical protein APHAL10511_007997 [Amanita phalloides]
MIVDATLFKIFRAYSSLAPPKSLCIPSHVLFTELQEFFISTLLLNPHFHQYPPSVQYQKGFWKWAILAMENLLSEDEEIDSRLYHHYLATYEVHNQLPQSYVTYYWTPPSMNQSGSVNLDDLIRLTLLESRTVTESGTTGLRTWRASFVLADYLLNNREFVQGKRILELGSGIGFLGTIVATIQLQNPVPGSSLYLTDVDEQVLSRCQSNVALPCNASNLHPCIHFRALDWAMSMDNPAICQGFLAESDADVILGADIVFDPTLIPALIGMLRLYLSAPKRAFIAVTVRNVDTFALFINSVKDVNLAIDEIELLYQHVPFVELIDVDANNPVRVFQIMSRIS